MNLSFFLERSEEKLLHNDITTRVRYNKIIIHPEFKINECMIWKLACGSSGRPQYTQRADGKKTSLMPHREIWKLVNKKEIENQINHICDEITCINPNHLYDGTSQENRADTIDRGNISLRKLKGKEEELIKLYKEGVEQKDIATELNVCSATIMRYLNGANKSKINYVEQTKLDRDVLIKKLYDEGKGITEIMTIANTTLSVIYSVVPEIRDKDKSSQLAQNIIIKNTIGIEERNKQIKEDLDKGLTARQISVKYSISIPLVYILKKQL